VPEVPELPDIPAFEGMKTFISKGDVAVAYHASAVSVLVLEFPAGTRDMIAIATAKGLKVYVENYR
jgi:hypothetical protein